MVMLPQLHGKLEAILENLRLCQSAHQLTQQERRHAGIGMLHLILT